MATLPNTYAVTWAPDTCDVPPTDKPLKWLAHRATGCRWPELLGWVLTGPDGQIIAVNRDLTYIGDEPDVRAWATREIREHAGCTVHSEWLDVTGYEQPHRFETTTCCTS